MYPHGFVGEDEVIKINMELAQKKDFTMEDLEKLPEDIWAELIDGQMFYLGAPKVTHQRIAGDLYFVLRRYIEERAGLCKVYFAPISVRQENDLSTYLLPDVIVVCDESKLHEDGCYGAPDLVIEIASKSTRKRDYGLKMAKYRSIGVKEYWIVEPERRVVVVHIFEDESQNCLYSFDDEISFYLFPELKIRLSDLEQISPA